MRILLIHQYFLEQDDSGGSRFNEMTRTWSEQGHDITVLAGMIHANSSEKRKEYKGKYFVRKNHDGIEVWRCHVSESYNKNFLGRFWGYLSFVFSALWAGLFKVKGKYDLVLATSPPLFIGIPAYLLSRLKRIPLVFEVRDLWPESAIDSGIVTNKYLIKASYWFEAFIYKKAVLINVLTPAFRKILIEKKRVLQDKVILIPNASDFSLSDKILFGFDRNKFRKDNHLDNHFVITYVGAHGLANHLIQILDTAELLKDTNVLFQLIGDGMQKKYLMEEATNRKLENVKFVDPVPKSEVFKYIMASDMGTSVLKKTDTYKTIYSNKTFDYMACKTPILMVIDGVSRELVEEANCGAYAEPENPADIAAIIRQYLTKPELLRTQGENGYKYAKNHFDREKLANKYLKHLEQVVKK
ncbi:MAG: glycosyltransferase family 4 protein [Bacteroidales bacterium]|nr:glycosyltransferase family 4 protein [Bacteroidales bacterium]